MKHVFLSSYKSVYRICIALLWSVAIVVALTENGFLASFAFRALLSQADVQCKSVRGGLFSGLIVESVNYRDKVKADEIKLSPRLLPLLNGSVHLSLLTAKNLRVDEVWLEEQLKQPSHQPAWLHAIVVDRADLSLAEHKFDEFVQHKAVLKAKNIFYDFKHINAQFSVNAQTNIINFEAQGSIKDSNITAKGSLAGSGGQFINRLVDDVDFDFNALKATPFELTFDGTKLQAKTLIHDSGIIYRFNIDARVVKSDTRVSFDFSNNHLRVDNEGEFACKYGRLNGKFSILYDGNHTTYGGTGKIHHFDLIPLGVFAKWVKVDGVTNEEAHFDGDVKELNVYAKGKAQGSIKGVGVTVHSSDTHVYVNFRSKLVTVDTNARCDSEYGSFEVQNRYEEPLKGFNVTGKVSLKQSKNTLFEPSLLEGDAHFQADENTLSVQMDTTGLKGTVKSTGFSKYDYSFITPSIQFDKLYVKLPSWVNGGGHFTVNGSYDSQADESKTLVGLSNASLGSRRVSSDELAIVQNSDSYELLPSKILVGRDVLSMAGKYSNQEAFVKIVSPFFNVQAQGNPKTKIQFDAIVNDLYASYSMLNKVDGKDKKLPKERLDGSVQLQGEIYNAADSPVVELRAYSPQISSGDFKASGISFEASYKNDTVFAKRLQADIAGKQYSLSHEAKARFVNSTVVLEGFNFGNLFSVDGTYKNGSFYGLVKVRNFEYLDPRLAKANVSGEATLYYENGRLKVEGEADVADVKLFYTPKGVEIARDKDIKVVRKKRGIIATDWFLDSVETRILLNTDKAIEFKNKQMSVNFTPHLVLYKDFGRKPAVLGLLSIHSGDYNLEGKHFSIKGGEVTLFGEEGNQYLDLALGFTENDVAINIGVKGFSNAPKLTLTSKPAMSEREIISYLLFGVEADSSFSKTSNAADYSSKALAALSGVLSRDLAMELGVKLDKIEISPSDTQRSSGAKGTTKVEIGKKISKDLMIIYKNDIDSSVALQYRLNKNMGVESELGNRRGSVDLFYKQDY